MKKIEFKMPTRAELKKQRPVLVAAGGLMAVTLFFHLLWLTPLLLQKEGLETLVRQQKSTVDKYQEKLKQAKSIQENLTKQEQELKEMQKQLFRGNDPYQLAAALGELISPKDGPKMLDIKTYQVLASKEYGLYQEVHLRFNFMTNIAGLDYFLNRIKESPTAVLVQEINVQKIQRKGGPDLVVNVILAALMEKKEKS